MRLAGLIAIALMVSACDREQDITGTTAPACPQRSYSYNPRDMNQCVNACKACDRGTTVTCTTSCSLKGAR